MSIDFKEKPANPSRRARFPLRVCRYMLPAMKGVSEAGLIAFLLLAALGPRADVLTNFCNGEFPLIFATPSERPITAMKRDAHGNIYFCGTFKGSIQLGDTRLEESALDWDGYFAKMTSQGRIEWARQLNASWQGDINDIDFDSQGNPVICGSIARIHPTEGSGTNLWLQAFVAKYDPAGLQLWQKEFGDKSSDYGEKILIGTNDAIFLGSSYESETKYGTNEFHGRYVPRVLLSGLDAGGNLNWVHEVEVGALDQLALGGHGSVLVLLTASSDAWCMCSPQPPQYYLGEVQSRNLETGSLDWVVQTTQGLNRLFCNGNQILAAGVFEGDFYFQNTPLFTGTTNQQRVVILNLSDQGILLNSSSTDSKGNSRVDSLSAAGDRFLLGISTYSPDVLDSFHLGDSGTNLSSFMWGLTRTWKLNGLRLLEHSAKFAQLRSWARKA